MGEKIDYLGREMLSNEWISQSQLVSNLKMPSWEISRLVKQLETSGFVECRNEQRLIRGRPKRLCKLTQRGLTRFSLMHDGGAKDE